MGEDFSALGRRLASVDAQVRTAADGAGREPAEITRIVVTKFHPPELITRLRELGVGEIAENRQQEFAGKLERVPNPGDLSWHFVGQLQTNKARAMARAAKTVPLTVHAIDRVKLVDALDRAWDEEEAPSLDAFVQVNLTDDPARGGARPEDLEMLAERVAHASHLRLRGVMAVAPLGEDPAAAFARAAGLADVVRTVDPDARSLSAGMSGDFVEAIAAGATHLRIGSAITGNRPPRG